MAYEETSGALLGSVALSAAAVMPAAAQGYNWTGLYFGANAGWANSDMSWVYRDPTGALPDRPLNGGAGGGLKSDSGIVGGHLGYQQQFGQFVLGIEFAMSGTGAFGNNFGSQPCFNVAFNCIGQVKSLTTIGPRVGYAFNNWMLFVTGGYASGVAETRERNAVTGVGNAFSTSDRHDGWYIGGGIEYALSKDWIFGLEYQHVSLDKALHLSTINSEARNIDFESDVIRARLTFKIGARDPEPARPLK